MKPIRSRTIIKPEARSPSHPKQRLQPYEEIPFSPHKQIAPLLQRYNREISCVTRNQKVRKLASKKIEGHFLGLHKGYKSKQNNHSSCFKIRAKKKELLESQTENFWMDKLHYRQVGMRLMHEQYLDTVKQELMRRKEWSDTEGDWNKQQKIISQYNIIYQYRSCQLPTSIPL